MKAIVVFVIAAVSSVCAAKQMVSAAPAQAMFERLLQLEAQSPQDVVAYTNLFFGDDYHPERGKLRLTTIYAKADSSRVCYKSDYFEAKIIDYMCEIP